MARRPSEEARIESIVKRLRARMGVEEGQHTKSGTVLRLLDDFSGIGSISESVTNGLGIPGNQIRLFRTEYDDDKNALWHALQDYKDMQVTHVKDVRDAAATWPAVMKVLGGRPHLMMSSSPCLGFSALGDRKGLGQEESAYFIDSNTKRILGMPESFVHEITSNMTKQQREMFDVALSISLQDIGDLNDEQLAQLDAMHKDLIPVDKEKGRRYWTLNKPFDYVNPAKIAKMAEQLMKEGRLNTAIRLMGSWFNAMHNTHDFHASFPIDGKFRYKDDPLAKRKDSDYSETDMRDMLISNMPDTRGGGVYSSNRLLNTNIGPNDTIHDVFTRSANINKKDKGDEQRLSVKDVIGRPVANDNAAPSTQKYAFLLERGVDENGNVKKGGYGGHPLIVAKISADEASKVRNGKADEKTDGLYFVYSPKGEYKGKRSDALIINKKAFANQSDKIKAGEIYKIDLLKPRETAVLMGWQAKAGDIIASTAKDPKDTASRYKRVMSVFGDAYPQQQMTYILLHNPVLWRLFPDQMEAAARKFMSLKPSDIEIKRDLIPLGDFGHLAQQWRF